MNKITDFVIEAFIIRVYRQNGISRIYKNRHKSYLNLLRAAARLYFDWRFINNTEYWYHSERITTL